MLKSVANGYILSLCTLAERTYIPCLYAGTLAGREVAVLVGMKKISVERVGCRMAGLERIHTAVVLVVCSLGEFAVSIALVGH